MAVGGIGRTEGVPLRTIVREWGRLGLIGFGGPPTHIALLRELCVEKNDWIDENEFEDAIAATNLLPGPASTQLAIFCAWRLRGRAGGVLGGLSFILPGFLMIVALSAIFLADNPPLWILGAAAGAGAAVPAIAVKAGVDLTPASWRRIGVRPAERARWVSYVAVGLAAGATLGAYLVIVLVAVGLIEIGFRADWRRRPPSAAASVAILPFVLPAVSIAGLGALAWVALKVGALSYGGGFVIIPLMQQDAVTTYNWMTDAQFLNAVALGQVTPGPVVLTVAAVGFAAAGLLGAVVATVVAFLPSFVFVIEGGPRFDRLRGNTHIQAFLTGAGATVVGAIVGSALPLGLALGELWQLGILAAAALWLLLFRRGVVSAILASGIVGVAVVLVGAAVPQ